jgi:hypothetical protein
MTVVAEASVLVGELLRTPGRELLLDPTLTSSSLRIDGARRSTS